MDTQLALEHVDSCLAAIGEYAGIYERSWHDDSGQATSVRAQRLSDQVRSHMVAARAIADALNVKELKPRLASHPQAFDHEWAHAREALVDLRAHLASQDAIAAILAPSGPNLTAAGLHPRVWGAAAPLWDDGHLRQAIQMAAQAVEAQLQAVSDRTDKVGQDLAQVFSLAPPDVQWVRLRFSDMEEGSATWRSAHDGAAFLVRGVFCYVRNLASHAGGPDPSEHEALEQLALLSLVARMVERAEVVTA